MFYSESILTRKGPLANIWLAAHWDRRLSKAQIANTDIQTSVGTSHFLLRAKLHPRVILDDIVKGGLPPMALRLSGQLLLGVARIYWRKARYLLEDCSDAWLKIKTAFRPGAVDIPKEQTKAAFAAITMPTADEVDLLLADEEVDVDAILAATDSTSARVLKNTPHDFVLKESPNMMLEDDMMTGSPDRMRAVEFGDENGDENGFADMNGNVAGRASDKFEAEIEMARRASRPSELPLASDINFPPGFEDAAAKENERTPLSTLRASAAKALQNDFEGYMPDDGYGDDFVLMDDGIRFYNSEEGDRQALRSPIAMDLRLESPQQVPAVNTIQKTAKRKITVVLDDETEIPSATIQAQVRNTFAITVAKKVRGFDLGGLKAMQAPLLGHFGDELGSLFERRQRAEAQMAASMHEPASVSVPGSPRIAQADQPALLHEEPALTLEHEPVDFGGDDWYPEPEPHSLYASTVANGSGRDRLEPDSVQAVQSSQAALNSDHTNIIRQLKEMLTTLDGAVSFSSILPAQPKRRDAAKTFFELLVLHTKGVIKVEQRAAFGSISIAPKEALLCCKDPMEMGELRV